MPLPPRTFPVYAALPSALDMVAVVVIDSTQLFLKKVENNTMGANRIERCRLPLTSDDFEKFDKVADGRLYLSDVGGDVLSCLIERLIRTKDYDVRSELLEIIQNDLWEAIRNRLLQLQKQEGRPCDIKRRIDDLLRNEFSDRHLYYSASFKYEPAMLRGSRTIQNINNSYLLDSQFLSVSGSINGNFIINAWRLTPRIRFAGNEVWANREDGTSNGGAKSKSQDTYPGITSIFAMSAFKRDETVRFDSHFIGNFYFDPPPECVEQMVMAGGAMTFRDIGGVPLSLKASSNWLMYDVVPISDDLYDPRYETLSLYSELAYMLNSAGMVVTYDHVSADNVYAMLRDKEKSNSGSILTHLSFDNAYIRLGAGGGIWDEETEQLGGGLSASSGAEVHARLIGEWNVASWIRLNVSVRAAANYSDGDFIGWYPSWNISPHIRLLFQNVSLKAGGSVDGYRRDLNHFQLQNNFNVNAEFDYSPTDFFNMSLDGSYVVTDQNHHEAYGKSSWEVSTVLAFRLIEEPSLWLKTEGRIKGNEYENEENYRDGSLFISGLVSLKVSY